MVLWIIAAVALHAAYVLTPAALFLPREGALKHLGGRDDLPEPGVLTGRARRALANWQESLPVFVLLALAALVLGADDRATLGAMIFVLARVAYLPLYLTGLPGPRSLAWLVAVGGLVVMALSVASFV
ncbi:MAPEG family protein [Maritimibacter sp. DP1N21-5]|uniref:MAPEG family protein n=1 Tax=Maritimibacter sp. DP1N21-5 TaxID=2836867 RepID=UPI001C46FCD7|nr:MAPEG family protein [Maritimibacter sp. DP1N21-5]MBV7408083.1 MAPEG family protein [Maritimibacter sp. DP1N21-5]